METKELKEHENIEVVDDIKMEDELGELTTKQYKKSLRKERDMFKKHVEDGKKELDRYSKQVERVNKIRDIQMKDGNFRKITPTMKFEESEEYWKLQEEEQWDKIRQERVQEQGTIDRIKQGISEAKKQMDIKNDLLNKQ